MKSTVNKFFSNGGCMISVSDTHKMCKTRHVKNMTIASIFGMLFVASVPYSDVSVFAESTHTTMLELDDEKSLQKTVTVMSVPENNTLPWGTVKGMVNDPVQGYPVIIQFFKPTEERPIHVAQVNLKGDNSFEYKFRVVSIDEGKITKYFEGDYNVKIFKVVKTPKDISNSI
jgi:hypothetical protein